MLGDLRRLAFKDRWQAYIVSQIDLDTVGDSVANELALETNEVYHLVLTVTGQQYTDLLSAADIGSVFGFNELFQEVLWPLWKAGKSMTFCAQVSDCIENSASTQGALYSWSQLTGQTSGAGNWEESLPDSVLMTNMLTPTQVCDNDHRYGIAVGIVEAIHAVVLEIFQQIEILTNPVELAAEVGDNMPIAEIASTPLDVVRWIQDTIAETYDAAWSDAVKDAISCELFCLMLPFDPCQLTFEMIWETYLDAGLPFPPGEGATWREWFSWLEELPLGAAETTVKIGGLMGLSILKYGGKFGQFLLGIRSLQTTAQLLADDTNPDWAALCTSCPTTWIHEWCFDTHGAESWVIDDLGGAAPAAGTFVPGQGFQPEHVTETGWDKNLIRYLVLDESIPRVTSMTVVYDCTRGAFDRNLQSRITGLTGLGVLTENSGVIVDGDDQEVTLFVSEGTATRAYFLLRVSDYPTPTPDWGDAMVTKVILRGNGIDPFAGRTTC